MLRCTLSGLRIEDAAAGDGETAGASPRSLDVIRNKEYSGCMVTYERLQADRRRFLALTGLTPPEFQLLLSAFPRADQRLYRASRTAEGQPRRRAAGGGSKGRLQRP